MERNETKQESYEVEKDTHNHETSLAEFSRSRFVDDDDNNDDVELYFSRRKRQKFFVQNSQHHQQIIT